MSEVTPSWEIHFEADRNVEGVKQGKVVNHAESCHKLKENTDGRERCLAVNLKKSNRLNSITLYEVTMMANKLSR